MGCDGIWEIQSEQQICNVVVKGLKNAEKISNIAGTLLD